MKKRRFSIVGLTLAAFIITMSYSSFADGQVKSPKEYKINQISVDNTQSLHLNTNDYLAAAFEVNPTNNKNQDDFYIKVSNVTSGLYKVIINATNGYTFESQELNHDTLIPARNVEPNITYTITVISTSANPFKGDINISSHTEE